MPRCDLLLAFLGGASYLAEQTRRINLKSEVARRRTKMKTSPKFSVFVTLLLGAFSSFSSYAQEAGKAEKIIAASKAATGGANWDQIKSWQEAGKIRQGGLEGTYQACVDFPKVLTAEVFRVGPVKGSAGLSGEEPW